MLQYDVMLCDAIRCDTLICVIQIDHSRARAVRTQVGVDVCVMRLFLLSFLFFIFIDYLMWSNGVIICLNIMHVRPWLTTESCP